MAFDRNGLARNSSGVGNNHTIWTYRTLDAFAAVAGANYFGEAAKEMQRGDAINVWDDNLGVYTLTFVKTNDGVTVVIASGTTIGDV